MLRVVVHPASVQDRDGAGPRGFEAGKLVKGRKREIVVDTEGHLITGEIWPAIVQDRDAAAVTLKGLRRRFPWLEKLFADSGYAGKKLEIALIGEPHRPSKSSDAQRMPKASSFYPEGGWSSDPSRGSDATAGSTKITNDASRQPAPDSTSHPSTSSSVGAQVTVIFENYLGL